jgi:hypothetical protein
MVIKSKKQTKKQSKGSRVKVGKLELNKETVKNLTRTERKQIKGGQAARTNFSCPNTLCISINAC